MSALIFPLTVSVCIWYNLSYIKAVPFVAGHYDYTLVQIIAKLAMIVCNFEAKQYGVTPSEYRK